MATDYNEYMDQLLAQREGSLEGIRKQIEQRRNAHNTMADKVDLAPMASFVDAMTGSNMTQSFRGPTPFEKNQKVIQTLEDALMRGEGELAREQLAREKNEAFIEQTKANTMRSDQDREFNRWLQTEKLNMMKGQGAGPGGAGMKAPPHYRFTESGDLEPIPGGKAWMEIEEAKGKKQRQQEQTATQAATVVEDIGRALSLVSDSPGSFGPVGGKLGRFPGIDTNTKRVKGFIDSALSNVGFDQLNQMRQNSPTGGALGNVTEMQLKQLNSVLGKLDVEDPPEILDDNLKRVHNIYNDIVHGKGQGPGRYVLSFDEQGRPRSSEQMALEQAKMRARPSSPGASQTPAGKVMVFDPQTNQTIMIDQSQLEDALNDGAVEVN